MKIQAIYKGENGSIGFIKGETYWFWLETNGLLKVTPIGDHGEVLYYPTLRKFLNNWDIIE